MTQTQKAMLAVLKRIDKALDNLEESAAWSVKADQRFKKNQRVRLSERAKRHGIKLRGGGQFGRVVSTNGFSVLVLPDGYKKPYSYHHSFWERLRKGGDHAV